VHDTSTSDLRQPNPSTCAKADISSAVLARELAHYGLTPTSSVRFFPPSSSSSWSSFLDTGLFRQKVPFRFSVPFHPLARVPIPFFYNPFPFFFVSERVMFLKCAGFPRPPQALELCLDHPLLSFGLFGPCFSFPFHFN